MASNIHAKALRNQPLVRFSQARISTGTRTEGAGRTGVGMISRALHLR